MLNTETVTAAQMVAEARARIAAHAPKQSTERASRGS